VLATERAGRRATLTGGRAAGSHLVDSGKLSSASCFPGLHQGDPNISAIGSFGTPFFSGSPDRIF